MKPLAAFFCASVAFSAAETVSAKEYKSWLSYRVQNNNFLLHGAGEQERLRYTNLNFERRLKKSSSCDPRTASRPFPFDATTTSWRRCVNGRTPAPTNIQFKTRWDPVEHRFKRGYLTGPQAKRRTVRLNLKIPGTLSFTRGLEYDCDWEVRQTGLPTTTYNNEDCKAFLTKVTIGKDYQARATVHRYRKTSRKDQLIHTSQWFDFKVDDHVIVAMGDSFGSGEGNPHTYNSEQNPQTVSRNKKPPKWLDPRCHRSLFSSSGLATNVLANKYPTASFSLVNLACSGAESGHGLTKDYVGRASASQVAQQWRRYSGGTSAPTKNQEGFKGYVSAAVKPIGTVVAENSRSSPARYDLQSQVEQLKRALNCRNGKCQRNPDVIFLYIGINDIGFSEQIISVILGCADKEECREKTRATVERGTQQIKANLEELDQQFGRIGIPQSTPLYLIKYPNPLKYKTQDRNGRTVYRNCNDRSLRAKREVREMLRSSNGYFLGPVAGALGAVITSEGADFSEEFILKPLNQALETEAGGRANWNVLDRTEEMLGSGYCSAKRMFNRYGDSVAKQGYIQRNYFWKDHSCRTNGCEVYRQFALPTGAMHPNYSGHREVAVGLIEAVESHASFPTPR